MFAYADVMEGKVYINIVGSSRDDALKRFKPDDVDGMAVFLRKFKVTDMNCSSSAFYPTDYGVAEGIDVSENLSEALERAAHPENKVRCGYCASSHIQERVKGTQVNRVYRIEDGANVDGEIEEFVPDDDGTTFHCMGCGRELLPGTGEVMELEVK